jgi:competence protein ComEC
MRRPILFLLALVMTLPVGFAQSDRLLEIYIVDVEGGNAVLFVTPSRESVLIDSGNSVGAVRDAERIVAAAKDAGLRQIDHLITTHYHLDHVGGLPELASRIPIGHFIDRGGNVEPGANSIPANAGPVLQRYAELYTKAKHTIAKAGDTLPVKDLQWRIVSANGDTIKTDLPGGGSPNPECTAFKATETGNAEDALSVGSHIAFGKFKALHLGDLTMPKEFELVCPRNRLGTLSVLLGMHHGQPSSNSSVLLHATQPRVAIMNNGTQKGGVPEVMRTVYSTPGLEDLWQIHFSVFSGQEYTVPGMFIANTIDQQPSSMPIAPLVVPQGQSAPAAPVHDGPAYWIKITARENGSFTVSNSRNGFTKSYPAR